MSPGEIEYEFGVPIPGQVLPEALWARTAVKRLPERGTLKWVSLFGRDAPVVLDLGCGNGRFTIGDSLARPGYNHCAVDELPMVIRYATRRANQRGLLHARFVVDDVRAFVACRVAEHSVAEIHVYHPQPYHDARQAHRRVITPQFLADAHRALPPGGLLVLQTDNPDYWSYMVRVVPHFFALREQDGPWPDAPEGRTRREILARQRGLRIFRGLGNPHGDLDRKDALALAASLREPRFRTRGPWSDLDRMERESR
jgi:tRNA (guanine-N7-)-methyltransferase